MESDEELEVRVRSAIAKITLVPRMRGLGAYEISVLLRILDAARKQGAKPALTESDQELEARVRAETAKIIAVARHSMLDVYEIWALLRLLDAARASNLSKEVTG